MKIKNVISCVLFLVSNLVFCQPNSTKYWIEKTEFYLYENNQSKTVECMDSAIAKAHQSEPEKVAKYLIIFSQNLREKKWFENSKLYIDNALTLTKESKDSILLVDLHNEYGLWHYNQSRYAMALLEFAQSLEIATLSNDNIGQIISKINIGNVFKDINDYDMALKYYQQAHDHSIDMPSFNVKCLNNIGTVYIELDDFEKAKQSLNKALEIANSNDYISIKIDIFINLGIIDKKLSNYSKAKNWFEKALNFNEITQLKKLLCLINLYDIAIKTNAYKEISNLESSALNLSAAVNETTTQIELYEIIISYYQSKGDINKAFDFQSKLMVVKNDLHLHEKQIHVQQLKSDLAYNQAINQLNKLSNVLEIEIDKKNKMSEANQKLTKTNTLIIVLASISILLLLILIYVLLTHFKKSKNFNLSLQEKANELAVQNNQIINSMEYANSMERLLIQQMNPHFIFNSLTTIEASISLGELEFSKQYLQLFSGMLRKTLDYSRSASIPLIEEINFLKSYIELNQLNQKDSFECEFIYDEEEVNDFVNTPPMLVQPFVENALIHGLYHKTSGNKKLTIYVQPEDHYICWIIEDNGIGREKSASIKKQHIGTSHGTKITSDRIQWMQNIYKQQLSVEYIDLEEGTKVILKTPIIEN